MPVGFAFDLSYQAQTLIGLGLIGALLSGVILLIVGLANISR